MTDEGTLFGRKRLRVTDRGRAMLPSGIAENVMGVLVYMLQCADDSFYVGCATGDDLIRRIAEHQSGAFPGYTWSRRPVRLVWSEHFERITDAIAAERKLKGWSRAKKGGADPRRLGISKRLRAAARW